MVGKPRERLVDWMNKNDSVVVVDGRCLTEEVECLTEEVETEVDADEYCIDGGSRRRGGGRFSELRGEIEMWRRKEEEIIILVLSTVQ